MFFRKGEKLLLACLVGILVFAMSGCGIIGKFYETSTIEDFLNKNNPKDETEYTDVIDGDTSMSIIIQGNTDSEENSYVIELTDAMYETVSALATVGITAGVTTSLSIPAQFLIILYMYFGRVGVLTISLGFLAGDRAEERFRYAKTSLLIG